MNLISEAESALNRLTGAIRDVKQMYSNVFLNDAPDFKLPNYLRVGEIVAEDLPVYPALLPLGQMGGIAVKFDPANREQSHDMIQSWILQILEGILAGGVKISIIDAKQMGSSFRRIKSLGEEVVLDFVANPEQIDQTITRLHSESVSIITECLSRYPSIAEYNRHSGLTQPYRILAIADFPHGFREIEKLEAIIRNGIQAGVLVFLSYEDGATHGTRSIDPALSQLCRLGNTGNPKSTDCKLEGQCVPASFGTNYKFRLDREAVSESQIERQISQLVPAAAVTSVLGDGVEIAIGKSGGSIYHLSLGIKSGNYHGIIGGQSGKGKTVLLNNIVAKALENHSPNDLRFILMDCGGTGFHEFDEAPHVQAICRSSNVDVCVNMIEYIEKELGRREQLFRDAGVPDMQAYLQKTKQVLPKLICLIDEFHVLYTGTLKQCSYFDTVLVDKVIRTGRKFGMHLIVCTQSLGGGVRRSVLDNIPLRIALGMTVEQSNGFLGLRNDAATNLAQGEAVFNAKNGDLSANKRVKIDYHQNQSISGIIQSGRERYVTCEQFEKFVNH